MFWRQKSIFGLLERLHEKVSIIKILFKTTIIGSDKYFVSIVSLAEKIKETNPSEVDNFKTKMNEVVKKLLPRFKDFQFFTGVCLKKIYYTSSVFLFLSWFVHIWK